MHYLLDCDRNTLQTQSLKQSQHLKLNPFPTNPTSFLPNSFYSFKTIKKCCLYLDCFVFLPHEFIEIFYSSHMIPDTKVLPGSFRVGLKQKCQPSIFTVFQCSCAVGGYFSSSTCHIKNYWHKCNEKKVSLLWSFF